MANYKYVVNGSGERDLGVTTTLVDVSGMVSVYRRQDLKEQRQFEIGTEIVIDISYSGNIRIETAQEYAARQFRNDRAEYARKIDVSLHSLEVETVKKRIIAELFEEYKEFVYKFEFIPAEKWVDLSKILKIDIPKDSISCRFKFYHDEIQLVVELPDSFEFVRSFFSPMSDDYERFDTVRRKAPDLVFTVLGPPEYQFFHYDFQENPNTYENERKLLEWLSKVLSK